jgi:hypothetical protein
MTQDEQALASTTTPGAAEQQHQHNDEHDLLEEASQLRDLVDRVVRSEGGEAPAVHDRFRQIVE